MFRKNLLYFISTLLLLFFSHPLMAANFCRPKLWTVKDALWSTPFAEKRDLIKKLNQNISKYLEQAPKPVAVLGSAGQTNINDPKLKITRKALQDADHAAAFALLFKLTKEPSYLKKTQEILLAWASINIPTGNPIDESRLEGMIWAYDLIACNLAENNKNKIEHWLENLRQKKISWHFGPSTSNNNHRVHQLKMLLLLDKILNHRADWEIDLANAKKYSTINIDPQTGESIDYRQRHALHYQNFTLKAWLEISLLTGCCRRPVNAAFNFLTTRIRSNQIKSEFINSEARIDSFRDQGGFSYAKRGGTFNISEATMPIVTYFTIVPSQPDADLWAIVHNAKKSPWLSFLLARRMLWREGASTSIYTDRPVDYT